MNKRIASILATGLLATGLGLVAQQSTAHASGYAWAKTKNYNNVPMHAKTTGTAYMWNWNHTKKIHNLKNYPRTTWYLSKSVKMVKGRKAGIYYEITSGNGRVNGYIWRGYLTKGLNTNIGSNNNKGGNSTNSNNNNQRSIPDLNTYNSDAEYLNYINNNPNQNVAKLIMQQLPNAKLSLNLSKYAQDNGSFYWDDEDVPTVSYDKSKIDSTSVRRLTHVENMINNLSKDSIPTAAEIDAALTADGYPKSKQQSFNGSIGLVILNKISSPEGGLFSGSSVYVMN
ncbi:hypothetical protein [Lentilactobacillus kosonis]|uniref:D-alanyl-D-alanine carboxypeptidase n=1 Tax=Lentilactobacillus kosonis TaxID=2810561 RepID=A0A401FQ00_9LACO|nr:hypothetical protein [Lentilactobacillus kosonis]GAY74368.1 D-alanyl-D-alanine carboxypeptidase [Lentilactobacillus kosonis]